AIDATSRIASHVRRSSEPRASYSITTSEIGVSTRLPFRDRDPDLEPARHDRSARLKLALTRSAHSFLFQARLDLDARANTDSLRGQPPHHLAWLRIYEPQRGRKHKRRRVRSPVAQSVALPQKDR